MTAPTAVYVACGIKNGVTHFVERPVIGETPRSWLIEPLYRWTKPIKMPKKNPPSSEFQLDREGVERQWQAERDANWAREARYQIADHIRYQSVPADVLRHVAALVGCQVVSK